MLDGTAAPMRRAGTITRGSSSPVSRPRAKPRRYRLHVSCTILPHPLREPVRYPSVDTTTGGGMMWWIAAALAEPGQVTVPLADWEARGATATPQPAPAEVVPIGRRL